MMDQHQWLVVILLPLVWSISSRQVDSARPLPTSSTSQKNTWPWYSILPPMGQPTSNLLGITLLPISLPQPNFPSPPLPSPLFSFPTIPPLPPFSAPKFPSIPPLSAPKFPSIPPLSAPKFPSIPPFSAPKFPPIPPLSAPKFPSIPPFSAPKFPSIPPFSAPKFPSIPPISQPGSSFPPFSQPKLPMLPSIPPIPSPGKPDRSPRWLSLPPLPSWSTSSPPPPTIPLFPWDTASPPPPATPSFPWLNPTPPVPTIPSFPWNTPSPPPPATPSFPWLNPTPPVPTVPSFPWNTPSPPPPATPSFEPWLSSPPPPASLTLPWPLGPTAPTPPKEWTGPTLPPFGLPPGGPLFPNGIQFTFSNFSNTWLPEAGVKVTWESAITIELSLQLLVEALFKPISLIISQFADPSGPGSWGWKNGLTDSKYSADVSATCTTPGENGFPAKGLIVVQAPIDNTVDTAITWFTVLFNGWSKEKPFNATLDHTPGTFGGFVTNVTVPNLKSFCSHPGVLSMIAAKQGQYVLN